MRMKFLLLLLFMGGCVHRGQDIKPSANRTLSTPVKDNRAAVDEHATQICQVAEALEPETTLMVKTLAQKHELRLEGLKYRLKTKSSIVRKMRLIMKKGTPMEEVQIKDSFRYTMIVGDTPLGNYNEKVALVLQDLEKQGQKVSEVKNYWPDNDSYSGVNVSMQTPSNVFWELQFHTEGSYSVTKNTRDDYEELRDAKTSKSRKKELFIKMTNMWKKVKIPEGVLLPASLHHKEKILSRPIP